MKVQYRGFEIEVRCERTPVAAGGGGMSVPLPYLALVTDGIEIWAHYKRNGNAVCCAGYWILPQGEPLDCKGRRTAKDWRAAQRIAAEMAVRSRP